MFTTISVEKDTHIFVYFKDIFRTIHRKLVVVLFFEEGNGRLFTIHSFVLFVVFWIIYMTSLKGS